MPAEIRSLGAQYSAAGETVRLFEHLLIRCSGIGSARARCAAESLVGSGARALMSWGTAAGLDPALAPGMLILPQTVAVPGAARYNVHEGWRDKLQARVQMPVHAAGTLLATPTPLTQVHQKVCLFEAYGAVAADMESGAVAAVASDAGLPFLAVRAIVDGARMALPSSALAALNGRGELQLSRLLGRLLQHPAEWLSLLRLARGFRAARNTLALVASRAGAELSCP
jgi:adenosylhomocysteine nucleosidase